MATKSKMYPLNSSHTAGIYSDMTVDGPEIGTLVMIVDRAKNLPNRKTIGKQDPYCAARLGKEAKRTTTDIRGGQTPRWDQELRFTVHDSPDYNQVKVSVFHDDKKTDLIGETWLDLRDIIVPGGGQNDIWHSLAYRGKYAGEIRIELTYYDSRPKPEKPVAKVKQQEDKPVSGDSRRSPVKRRPLPSDPVTGESPQIQAEQATPPPRLPPKQPTAYIPGQSPLQAVEYGTPSSSRARQHEVHGTPPSAAPMSSYDLPSPAIQELPSRSGPRQGDRFDTPPQRFDERDYSPRYASAPQQSQQIQHQQPHQQPHQHHHQHQHQHQQQQQSPLSLPPLPQHQQHPQQAYDPFVSRPTYDPADSSAPVVPIDLQRFQPAWDDDRPPPPPVHRSRNNSSAESLIRGNYDMSPQKATPPMRHDVLRSEAHRHSSPSYPGRSPHRLQDDHARALPPASGTTELDTSHGSSGSGYGYEQPHQPNDPVYGKQYTAFQPSVEDAPESPTPLRPNGFRRSANQLPAPPYDDPRFDPASAPAPLNIGSGRSGSTSNFAPPPINTQPSPYDAITYQPSTVSPVTPREYGPTSSQLSHSSAGSQGQYESYQAEPEESQSHGAMTLYGAPPSVPASLVPGVDPRLSQELHGRIVEERRHERHQSQQQIVALAQRGRQRSEPPYAFSHDSSPRGYSPAVETQPSSVVTFSGPPGHIVKPKAISPAPSPTQQQTIRRKSVSPVPPARPRQEERRLSGIPFSPDSYDAFNSSFSSTQPVEPEARTYPDPNAKIIMHDGREVDPSDHLPMDTWAPEPEPREPTSGSADGPPRLSPAPPPNGRRQLRVAARPHSTSVNSVSYSTDEMARTPPTGRNRLQKKANRTSTMPPSTSPVGSSPLAPISSHNYQESSPGMDFTPPRMARASTWDYPNENHAPLYGSSPGGMHSNSSSGPLVPAKVPLTTMSGALVSSGAPAGQDDWALMEEMRRIDIGTGRSRRHAGY